MNFFISIPTVNKAKEDIEAILGTCGFRNLSPQTACSKKKDMFSRFFTKFLGVLAVPGTIRKGDILVLQYPMKKFYSIVCLLAHCKGGKVVTVIHDLGAFRRHKLTSKKENRRLSHTDFIIVHNETMKNYLLANGCKARLYSLNLFDYLTNTTPKKYDSPQATWKIVYAGGLGKWRNAFLYDLEQYAESWSLDIYGKGLETTYTQGWKHIKYKGFLSPDEFVEQVQADFGLVWDGDSVDCCSGSWGEYLRINTPHKTSFYLRAGLPVIVWSEAAISRFVSEQGIGLCVSSLSDINQLLRELPIERYREMKQRAMWISRQLGNGYFIKQALKNAFVSFGM